MEIIEYLGGYLVALTLALSATASVSIFLIGMSISPMLLFICCSSTFILNLILFWQCFPSITQAFYTLLQKSDKQNSNQIQPTLMTLSACFILHVFTFNSFISLSQQFALARALLPTSVVHLLTLLSSLGNFGLYYSDSAKIISNPNHNNLLDPLIWLCSAALIYIPLVLPKEQHLLYNLITILSYL